jgi:hypothetical protein
MESPVLVTVRFTTSRGGICGVHHSGMEYEVPPAFARQVVEQEHVAEYVTSQGAVPSGASVPTGMTLRKKR